MSHQRKEISAGALELLLNSSEDPDDQDGELAQHFGYATSYSFRNLLWRNQEDKLQSHGQTMNWSTDKTCENPLFNLSSLLRRATGNCSKLRPSDIPLVYLHSSTSRTVSLLLPDRDPFGETALTSFLPQTPQRYTTRIVAKTEEHEFK
jgi:hypothetical protein